MPRTIKASAASLNAGTRDTVTFAVADQTHDRYAYEGDPGLANTNTLIVNDILSTKYNYRSSAYLTPTVAGRKVPTGATIISAQLKITAKTGANAVVRLSRFALERSLAPAVPTSKADLDISGGRPKTALLIWGPSTAAAWTDNAVFYIDLLAQAQEVRALGGGDITNFLVFWLPYVANSSWGGTNNSYQAYAHNLDPTKVVELEIVYETGGSAQPPAYTFGGGISGFEARWNTFSLTNPTVAGTLGGAVLQTQQTGAGTSALVVKPGAIPGADGEMLVKLRQVSGSALSMGVVQRSAGTATAKQGYALRLTPTSGIQLRYYSGSTNIQITTALAPYPATAALTSTVGSWYWLRLRVQGNNLYGKGWADGSTEPTDWMCAVTSTVYAAAGEAGVDTVTDTLAYQYDYFQAWAI